MKNFIYLSIFVVAMFTASCSSDIDEQSNELTKEITFTCSGDFSLQSIAPITRATIGDVNATDLWVFDYINGELIQEVCQKKGDTTNFGNPILNLAYGHHKLYFVISNGNKPIVDKLTYNIRWETPGDTFHSVVDIDINDSSDKAFIVNMRRIAAKLVLRVEGDLPSNATSFKMATPQFFYSINYTSGTGIHEKQFRYITPINPLSNEYVYYTLMQDDKLCTQADVSVLDTEGITISSANICPLYLERGKCSTYSGTFVYNDSCDALFDFTIPDWEQGTQGTW